MEWMRMRGKTGKKGWYEERLQSVIQDIFMEEEQNSVRRMELEVQPNMKPRTVSARSPRRQPATTIQNIAQTTDYPIEHCKPVRNIVLGQVNSFLLTEGTFFDFLSSIKPQQLKKARCKCENNRCKAKYCNCLSWGQACDANCQCLNCQNMNVKVENVEKENVKCRCTKKTRCLKKYCECRKFGKNCSSQCQCVGCMNGSMDVEYSASDESQFDSSS